jgi:hypothetical protein
MTLLSYGGFFVEVFASLMLKGKQARPFALFVRAHAPVHSYLPAQRQIETAAGRAVSPLRLVCFPERLEIAFVAPDDLKQMGMNEVGVVVFHGSSIIVTCYF